jgi:hypothetical protein
MSTERRKTFEFCKPAMLASGIVSKTGIGKVKDLLETPPKIGHHLATYSRRKRKISKPHQSQIK